MINPCVLILNERLTNINKISKFLVVKTHEKTKYLTFAPLPDEAVPVRRKG